MDRRKGLGAVAAVAAAAFAAAGPVGAAGASAQAHRLHVDLAEWAVVPSHGLVSAGELRLTVRNEGRLVHELDIVPTRRWGQTLRVRDGLALGKGVARPVVVAPGQTRAVTVTLAPGAYVLLDNIRDHYRAGASVSILAR